MKLLPAGQDNAQPRRRRRREKCHGCGGFTDGRHLDRELLKDATTDDEAQKR